MNGFDETVYSSITLYSFICISLWRIDKTRACMAGANGVRVIGAQTGVMYDY